MTTEEPKNRSATYLIDNHVPYSDMNDEEIAAVVEWRAEMKAQADEVRARQKSLEDTEAKIIEKLDRQKSEATAAFEDIVGRITARAVAVEKEMAAYE